jgi:hypothetical protein
MMFCIIRGTISDGHDFIEKQSCKVPLYATTHFQKILQRSYLCSGKDTNSALHLWLPIIMVIHHKT